MIGENLALPPSVIGSLVGASVGALLGYLVTIIQNRTAERNLRVALLAEISEMAIPLYFLVDNAYNRAIIADVSEYDGKEYGEPEKFFNILRQTDNEDLINQIRKAAETPENLIEMLSDRDKTDDYVNKQIAEWERIQAEIDNDDTIQFESMYMYAEFALKIRELGIKSGRSFVTRIYDSNTDKLGLLSERQIVGAIVFYNWVHHFQYLVAKYETENRGLEFEDQTKLLDEVSFTLGRLATYYDEVWRSLDGDSVLEESVDIVLPQLTSHYSEKMGTKGRVISNVFQ